MYNNIQSVYLPIVPRYYDLITIDYYLNMRNRQYIIHGQCNIVILLRYIIYTVHGPTGSITLSAIIILWPSPIYIYYDVV